MKLSDEVSVHRNSFTIFVPANIPNAGDDATSFCAGWLGGYTQSNSIGGWIGDGSEMIQEFIIQVEGFATDYVSTYTTGGGESDYYQHPFDEWVDEYLLPAVKQWVVKWKQQSIGLKVNGAFYVIYGD